MYIKLKEYDVFFTFSCLIEGGGSPHFLEYRERPENFIFMQISYLCTCKSHIYVHTNKGLPTLNKTCYIFEDCGILCLICVPLSDQEYCVLVLGMLIGSSSAPLTLLQEEGRRCKPGPLGILSQPT